MSASKKRKERQAVDLSNATEKQRREALEAQQAQMKTKLYWAIGIIATVLVIILLVWNSGIFQRKTTAATVGDQSYTVSDMSFYYGNVLNSLVSMQSQYSSFYSQLGMTFTNYYDTSLKASEQIITDEVASNMSSVGITDAVVGQTFEEYIKTQALAGLQSDVLICAAAAEAGYTLSAEGQATVDETIDSYKSYATSMNYTYASYLTATYGSHMTQSVFEERVTASTLATEYMTYVSEAFNYSEADYTAYYEENTSTMDSYEYRMAFISGYPVTETDEDGNTITPTDDEIAQAMLDAEQAASDMMNAIEDGAAFNEAAGQYVAESTQYLYDDAEYNHITGSLGSSIATSSYGAWLIDGTHTPGELTMVEDTTSNGYYVIQYLDRTLDTETLYSSEIRHILVKADVDEVEEGEVAVPTDDQMAAAKARAEEIQAEFLSGAQTADDFAILADVYSEDPGSNGTSLESGGSSGGYYEVDAYTGFFTDFQNWALDGSHAVGDLGLIENTQSGQEGYHLMYFQAAGLPVWQNTADSALRYDAYNVWYEDLMATATVTAVDEGMAMLG